MQRTPWNYEFLRIVEVPEPPKPRYVPFTRETCPVGAVVKDEDGNRHLILFADLGVAYISRGGWVCFERLLIEPWTMDDGTPCGTLSTES